MVVMLGAEVLVAAGVVCSATNRAAISLEKSFEK